jgi:molecular chaperone HtpG
MEYVCVYFCQSPRDFYKLSDTKLTRPNVPASKPILEINPLHPLVLRLKYEPDEARFADLAKVLFDQSLPAEGGQLEDPAGFVKRWNQLMLAWGN